MASFIESLFNAEAPTRVEKQRRIPHALVFGHRNVNVFLVLLKLNDFTFAIRANMNIAYDVGLFVGFQRGRSSLSSLIALASCSNAARTRCDLPPPVYVQN